MKAIIFERFGGPEVLRLTNDVPAPHPGPGQVRVRVSAAAVNQIDSRIRRGWMTDVFPTPLPAVPGMEIAGTVDEVGPGVTDLAVGDEVAGWSDTGGYATYSLATAVVRLPAGLDVINAAALPMAIETAQRVIDLLGVGAGETLLVHGAAGVVGSVAVQLATAAGATVVGTASPANHAYVRELGAIPVMYGQGLVERVREAAPQGVDAVFDAAGKGALPDSIALRGGTTERIVTVADTDAAAHGVMFSFGEADHSTACAGLARHLALAARGELRVRVAATYPLADAAKVQTISETDHVQGKLLLVP
jgi:NADPH:quinone reductase-like Zn-dependent oxidoreductase